VTDASQKIQVAHELSDDPRTVKPRGETLKFLSEPTLMTILIGGRFGKFLAAIEFLQKRLKRGFNYSTFAWRMLKIKFLIVNWTISLQFKLLPP
jgi:hypothetical protein